MLLLIMFYYLISYGEASVARFVACGTGNFRIAWTDDGVTWIGVAETTFAGAGRGCAFSPNLMRYVCVGEGPPNVLYSNDGKAWSIATGTTFQAWGYSVAWGGNRFVAAGLAPGPELITSFDGISWSVTGGNFFPRRSWMPAYSAKQDRWITVGGSGLPNFAYANGNDTILQWSAINDPIFSANQAFGVEWIDQLDTWVGVGDGNNVAIAFSKNGFSWTPSLSNKTILSQGKDSAYYKDRLIVVGTQGELGFTTGVSTDAGATFQGIQNPISTIAFRLLYSACLNLWVTCGQSLNDPFNSITISKDGETFIGLGNKTFDFCLGLASPPESIAPAFVPTGSSESTRCSARVTPATQSLVQGSYISESSLVVPETSTLVVSPNGTVAVQGTLEVAGTISVDVLGKLSAQSLIVTSNSSALIVDLKSLVQQAQNTQSSTTAATVLTTSDGLKGAFSSVQVIGLSNSDCVMFDQPITTYTSSTISVTVSFTNKCLQNQVTQPRLSTGAIVGIAIGTSIAAVAMILAIVFIVKISRRMHTNRLKKEIRKNEMQGAMSPMLENI